MVQSSARSQPPAASTLPVYQGSRVGRVLVVDPDVAGRKALEGHLRAAQHALVWTHDYGQLAPLLQSYDPEVVVLELSGVPQGNGLKLLEETVAAGPGATLLAVVPTQQRGLGLEAVRLGAENYVTKPFEPDAVVLHLRRALEKAQLRRDATRLGLVERESGPVPVAKTNELPGRVPGLTMAELERWAILTTLAAVGGSTAQAAALLGISQRKIQYRIKEWGEDGRAESVSAGSTEQASGSCVAE